MWMQQTLFTTPLPMDRWVVSTFSISNSRVVNSLHHFTVMQKYHVAFPVLAHSGFEPPFKRSILPEAFLVLPGRPECFPQVQVPNARLLSPLYHGAGHFPLASLDVSPPEQNLGSRLVWDTHTPQPSIHTLARAQQISETN